MVRKELLRESFTQELSAEERTLFALAIEESLLQIINCQKSAFLEGFGILYPLSEKKIVSHSQGDKNVRRSIKTSSLHFQKCSELTAFYRSKYTSITEERELAEVIFSKLPLNLQLKWQFNQTRKYLRGFIDLLKQETITQGFSNRLGKLGEFYALHNRQGSHINDWYAGSNILFNSKCDYEIASDGCAAFERPVLETAWELMDCIYGKPIHIFNLNIEHELQKLGFDLDQSMYTAAAEQHSSNNTNSVLQIAVYAKKSASRQELIYCSDGLRLFALNSDKEKPGNELVFQVSFDADFRESAKNSAIKLDDLILPDWPKTVFIMGWIMLQSSKNKRLRIGDGLSLNATLCQEIPISKLSAVLACKFNSSQIEHLSKEGPFTYINLVGITKDEYHLAESHSVKHLINLLRLRNLDQLTKVGRPSIMSKTCFLDSNSEINTTSSDIRVSQADHTTDDFLRSA